LAPRQRFGSRKRFGYPLLKALTLFDPGGGATPHQIPLPHARQEAPPVGRLLRHLARGDVPVLDRAFASFANPWLARRAGVHLLLRLRRGPWARPGTRRTVRRRLGRAAGDRPAPLAPPAVRGKLCAARIRFVRADEARRVLAGDGDHGGATFYRFRVAQSH
jgi:hypothetical protein